MLSVILTMVDRAIIKAPQSSALRESVEQARHRLDIETSILDSVVTHTIDDPAFTLPVAFFLKQGVEKRMLVRAQMKEWHKRFVKTVSGFKTKEKDGLPLLAQADRRAPRRTYLIVPWLSQNRTVRQSARMN